VRDGDEWVVTGQKVWTTLAHHAKWCMLVARTDQDAPRHKGLTYFLMDMEQDARPGAAAPPDHRRGGVQRAVHRGGRIPLENIIGGEGNGWDVAITTLMHERATLAFGLQIRVKITLGELLAEARGERSGRGPGHPRPPGAALHRVGGAAPQRAARAQRDHAHRRPPAPRARSASGSGPTSTRR
jgi:alkylation response protein AidB-like acyl-CoA dehydrogenase